MTLAGSNLSIYDLPSADEEYTNEQLQEIIEKLEAEIKTINFENMFFERFLERNDIEAVVFVNRATEVTRRKTRINFQQVIGGARTRLSSGFRRSSGSQSSIKHISRSQHSLRQSSILISGSRRGLSRVDTISINMKIEMVDAEISLIEKERENLITGCMIEMQDMLATQEQINIANKDIMETLNDFEEYVVIQGIDPQTQKISESVFTKFINKWEKKNTSQIEKSRLRLVTLKNRYNKQKLRYRDLKGLNKHLRPIHYEELLIQRDLLKKTILNKNNELLGLKASCFAASIAQADAKRSFQNVQQRLEIIKNKRMEAEKQVTRFLNQQKPLYEDIENWEKKIKSLKQRLEAHKPPSIEEYINLDHEIQKMENELADLQTQ